MFLPSDKVLYRLHALESVWFQIFADDFSLVLYSPKLICICTICDAIDYYDRVQYYIRIGLAYAVKAVHCISTG